MVQPEYFRVRLPIAMVMTATVTIGQTPVVKVHQLRDLLLVRRLKQMMTGPITPITTDVIPMVNPSTALNNNTAQYS